ncbi:MAG: hypothetical protein IJ641_07985, partial [Lachnospiraceae bacterium]|nr:hypothetical protein [Lachnospiraceae bacterium]
MSVAGLEMYSGAGFYYTSMQMGGNNGLSSGESEYDELLLAKTDTEKESTQQSTKALTQVPYTRCITASYKINELIASQADDGRMIYSYKASEQSFQIYINSDGEKKTYTVSGIDKKGSPFEKEFNPYEVDPENADFPEFAALCMYIKQTDDTADLLANDYFQPDDILERKDYLGMLENFDAEGAFSLGKKMMLCALDLVNSLNEYLNYRMKLSGMSEEERIDLLLSDIDNQTENTEPISESVITRNTEYIDPTTKERIPVDIRYIT